MLVLDKTCKLGARSVLFLVEDYEQVVCSFTLDDDRDILMSIHWFAVHIDGARDVFVLGTFCVPQVFLSRQILLCVKHLM